MWRGKRKGEGGERQIQTESLSNYLAGFAPCACDICKRFPFGWEYAKSDEDANLLTVSGLTFLDISNHLKQRAGEPE